jgi:hypothetical protein
VAQVSRGRRSAASHVASSRPRSGRELLDVRRSRSWDPPHSSGSIPIPAVATSCAAAPKCSCGKVRAFAWEGVDLPYSVRRRLALDQHARARPPRSPAMGQLAPAGVESSPRPGCPIRSPLSLVPLGRPEPAGVSRGSATRINCEPSSAARPPTYACPGRFRGGWDPSPEIQREKPCKCLIPLI